MRVTPGLRRVAYLVAALVIAAAFVAVYEFFVRTHAGQVVDERAFLGASLWRSGLVAPLDRILTVLPLVSFGGGAILVLLIAAVRRNGKVLVAAIAAALAANATTQLLKYAILDRPNMGIGPQLANSMPSGHTTAAATTALAVFLVSSPGLRPLVATLGAAFSTLIGAATLINQWHRPSDVIAALLVVAFWACAAGFALADSEEARAASPRRGPALPLLVGAASCAIVAGYGFRVTLVSTATPDAHLLTAYAGGIASIAAVALGLAWVGIIAFRWVR
ncbi:MAG TPA: phosphatase PAP2 family protein [Microbacteriaceae bacterium]|nr:phosphatase PAP2 family protein [Microbacteriaceae bacterium]